MDTRGYLQSIDDFYQNCTQKCSSFLLIANSTKTKFLPFVEHPIDWFMRSNWSFHTKYINSRSNTRWYRCNWRHTPITPRRIEWTYKIYLYQRRRCSRNCGTSFAQYTIIARGKPYWKFEVQTSLIRAKIYHFFVFVYRLQEADPIEMPMAADDCESDEFRSLDTKSDDAGSIS